MPYKDKEKRRAADRTNRATHREQRNAVTRAHHRAHWEQEMAYKRVYRQTNRAQIKVKNRTYIEALTAEALRVLGSTCACPGCGVSEPAFLTFDHINGRPKGPRKTSLFEARASGWDKTQFQILCANCNFAKRDRGFCPVHQTDQGEKNGHSPGGNTQQSLWPSSGD
jgi:5-methylcytosine-specific restriction endonuclease McrA